MPPAKPLASLHQLVNTHRRQGEVMLALVDAARRLSGGRGGDEALAVVRDAADFLGRAVPRHFADEEASLFPRLRARRPDLGNEIDRIVAEHALHLELGDRIAGFAAQWGAPPRPAEAIELLELAERLAALHEEHVAAEQVVFAAAVQAVTPDDDDAITREMDARRGRGGGGGGGGGGSGGGRGADHG
jgi:iron-sulfur cluster repair protein YtfE (RIC family)